MRRAPWLKRIELSTGALSHHALEPGVPFTVSRVAADGAPPFEEHVLGEDGSWFHVARRGRQWMLHGSTMSSGSALYSFMEHPEARDAQLEAAVPSDDGMAAVYADWLEEQGDPFAAALKPELLRASGPAGLWWLEGLERHQQLSVTSTRAGFPREALLHRCAPQDLLGLLHRVTHLRAFLALERLTIDASVFRRRGEATWETVFSWSMWLDCRWPASLRTLCLQLPDDGVGPSPRVLAAMQERLSSRHPQLRLELARPR